jgi:hypothetical protein
MAETENLKFRKPHMTNVDGYFYMFDDDTDMLLAKSDDGSTAFSYPFDTLMSESIVSVEHDGVNYWSLEPGDADVMVVRRWRIENYICKLQETITLSNPAHTFDSEAFTVEHYHCTISGSYAPGDTMITLDADDIPGNLATGMEVTLKTSTTLETIMVQDVSGNVITLADPIENSYTHGNELLFYNYMWLFNNAYGTDTSKGALYKINAYSGSVVSYLASGAYRGIRATTFYEIDHFTEFGAVNALMFVKASNLLFVNVHDSQLSYYGSMAMDTINADEVTIIPVYDITVKDKNLYRLQKAATYFGSTSSWTNYSYQPATFNTMVASISVTASPNVLAANQVSTSELTARVRDQFGQPVTARLVYFEDDDADGEIVSGSGGVNTNSAGEASAVYKSGLSARLVSITARVDQS